MPTGAFLKIAKIELKAAAKRIFRGEPSGGVELDGMSLIDLATLNDLVTSSDKGVDLLLAASQVSGGATVELPSDFVAALSGMDGARVAEVAAAWANTEEFRGLFTPEELQPFLKDLAQLAQSAIAEKQPVMFVNV
ncbi:MAG: hypothetical protein ACYC7A_06160 [Thermoanaerobaculia bacterium]